MTTDPVPQTPPEPPAPNQSARWPRLALVALAFLLGCFEMGDYDVWWHLRTGQLIPERGVPRGDWYSFVAPDHADAWIDVHWGFQVILAWVYDRFGVAGIILLKASVGALAVAAALTAWKRDWPASVQIWAWIPALLLMSSRLYERPEVFTLLFTAIYLSVLLHADERPSLLWLLPIVQVGWANVQGLFIFGPILLAMFWVESILRLGESRGRFRHLMPVTVLVGGACVTSPYRFGNLDLVRAIWIKMDSGGNLYRENIAELIDIASFWKTGGFLSVYAWLLLLLLGMAALSSILAWRPILVERRVFRLLALAAFGWLSLKATRNGNHFALVAGTIIGWNLGSIAPGPFPPRRWPAIVSLLLVLSTTYLVASGRWHLWAAEHRRLGFGTRLGQYDPTIMKLAGQPGMPERAAIFHLGHAAEYILHNGPQRKVYMDGRLEVHTQETFRDYLAIEEAMKSGGDWDAHLRGLQTDALIIDGEYNAPLQAVAFAHPRWQCVAYDETLALFLHRSHRLPPEVKPWDFRRRLFDPKSTTSTADRPPPRSPPFWWFSVPPELYPDRNDLYAERAFYLGLGFAAQPDGDPVQKRAVLWNAAQSASLSIIRRPWNAEGYRHLGAALLFLNYLDDPPDRGAVQPLSRQWSAPEELVASMSLYILRQATECNRVDYSSNYYLQDSLSRDGILDDSIEPLQRLGERLAKNWAQIAIAKEHPRMLSERRAQVEKARSSLALDDPSFENLNRLANAGLLGTAAQLADASTMTPDQLDIAAGWFLRVGRPRGAAALYGLLEAEKSLPAERLDLQLGFCAAVLGNYAEARRRLQSVLDRQPDSADALFGLAILDLLAGAREPFEIRVGRALRAELTSPQRAAFARLQRLLPAD